MKLRTTASLVPVTLVLLAGPLAAGASGRSGKPRHVNSPVEAEGVVAYGPSQVLTFQYYFPTTVPAITRVDTDGRVDRSFGEGGTVAMYANAIAVDDDGRILLASDGKGEAPTESKSLLTRLLPDGGLDPSFGTDGFARIPGSGFGEATAVAIESNGDILLAGDRLVDHEAKEQCVQVVRLGPDGSLDPSFGEGGVATLFCGAYEEGVLSVGATPSGLVIAIGNDFEVAVVKLRDDGSRDPDFGRHELFEMPGGHWANGRHESLMPVPEAAVMPDGKVLLAATGERSNGASSIVATRLLPDGRVDHSYGDGGWATGKLTSSVGVQAEGLTLFGRGVLAVATTFEQGEDRDFGAVAFDDGGHLKPRFSVDGDCRSSLPGKHEVIGVVDDRGRAIVLGGAYSSSKWLLDCGALAK